MSVGLTVHLVSTPAFFWPQHFEEFELLLAYFSCLHRSPTAKCLISPRPRRLELQIAAEERERLCNIREIHKSAAMMIKQGPTDAPLTMPPKSASSLLRAMVVCVADQCFSVALPSMSTPLVLLRVVRHPATSVSAIRSTVSVSLP